MSNSVNLDIKVNREQLDDTIEELKDTEPNITIRNNQNVYVTINNFNESEKNTAKKQNRYPPLSI
jgi:hypothetical protein